MKPNIYFFNPTCELAVANGSSNFMAPARLRRFENELSTLPAILASKEDIILSEHLPSLEYLVKLESLGLIVPKFLTLNEILPDLPLTELPINFLIPWGWSPAAHKLLLPLKQYCSQKFLSSPVFEWKEIHRELYSRNASLTILNQLVTLSKSEILLPFNDLPEKCTTHDQIISLQKKWERVVVKAPWSASGRGLQVLRKNEYNQSNIQVIGSFLNQQGYVIAGPWHERVMDFSFQFFSHGSGSLEYMGFTSFRTDKAGRFEGIYVQELPHDIDPELIEFILEYIPQVQKILHGILNESRYSADYFGWLGVDAMIYKTTDRKYKIQPCLEINCRLTMGTLALKLRSHLAEGSLGDFKIIHGPAGYFHDYCSALSIKEPLILESGKISEGFLPLTPVTEGCIFGACLRVSRRNKI